LLLNYQIFLETNGGRTIRNEPEYVHEACEKSLKRLGIETIDLFYCHRFNGKVPVEDVVGAMAELVKYVEPQKL
jgi:aryl-alcohol dehydrogenase-like predicted oxidoreductase